MIRFKNRENEIRKTGQGGYEMEFEKLQEIIAEVLNIEENEVTMESTFVDDRELKKHLMWRFQMRLLKKL